MGSIGEAIRILLGEADSDDEYYEVIKVGKRWVLKRGTVVKRSRR
jgi:hypothetical protein